METVLRVVIVYAFLLIALRVIGKRDIGQLAPFDLVILLLIPELVAQGLVREDFSLINAIIGASTLLALVFLTSVLVHQSRTASRLIEGEPAVLVRHGFLVPDAMNRERIAPGELLAEMHKAGLERMEQVKWAILETDGQIAFVPWEPGSTHPAPDEQLA